MDEWQAIGTCSTLAGMARFINKHSVLLLLLLRTLSANAICTVKHLSKLAVRRHKSRSAQRQLWEATKKECGGKAAAIGVEAATMAAVVATVVERAHWQSHRGRGIDNVAITRQCVGIVAINFNEPPLRHDVDLRNLAALQQQAFHTNCGMTQRPSNA